MISHVYHLKPNYHNQCMNKIGLGQILFGQIPDIWLISNSGYPVPGRLSDQRSISGKLPDIRPDNRISGIKIRQISSIRIVSITAIRPDIENGWISGPTLE